MSPHNSVMELVKRQGSSLDSDKECTPDNGKSGSDSWLGKSSALQGWGWKLEQRYTKVPTDDAQLAEENPSRSLEIEKKENEQKSGSDKVHRWPNLDSLRGVGCLIVIAYHMGYTLANNAWMCISIFFSMSGFVITAITVESFERRGFLSILRFWARRISRLFPALFEIVIVIAISQRFRYDDGITFGREKEDLLYAATFLTNYNLVFNNKDDYFDDFAQPSITRHLWTLSIEEQYYILWPLLLFALTYAYQGKVGQNETPSGDVSEGPSQGFNKIRLSPVMKKIMFLFGGADIGIILMSYFSSWKTIDRLGMSAAYFSTWCRMGDIACGGLSYSIFRLNPSLSRRYFRDPTVEPMSTKFRIVLEILSSCSIGLIIFVPMIQTPVEVMLPMYFQWLRLPFSFFVCFFAAAGLIQSTEKLPRWAVISRLLCWPPLVFMGFCSYGIYLFHWPLIVFFGDPRGKMEGLHQIFGDTKFALELEYHLRNLIIVVASIVMGIVSFMYVEKPALMKAKELPPWKTVMFGFMGMGATMITVLVMTKSVDSGTFLTNDAESVFGSSSSLWKSPIYPGLPEISDRQQLYRTILDESSRVELPKQIEPKQAYDIIRNAVIAGSTDNATIVMCKTFSYQLPCEDSWPKGAQWVWLNSTQLCRPKFINRKRAKIFLERCDDIIPIVEIVLKEEDTEYLALESMVLELDKAFPGSLNEDAIERVKTEYSALKSGNIANDGWNDPIRLTVIGESVAQVIGMNWKDTLKGIDSNAFVDFPGVTLFNLAVAGSSSIGYFLCQSKEPFESHDEDCLTTVSRVPNDVPRSFSMTKPDVVVVHDTHWAFEERTKLGQNIALRDDGEKIAAFSLMLQSALLNGAKSLIYLTISANDHSDLLVGPAGYWKELESIMKVVDVLGCTKGDKNSFPVTVVDWARLTCPTLLSTGKCPPKAHNFNNILQDGMHPRGESGFWLTNTLLAAIMAHVATLLPTEEYGQKYFSWDQAIQNPFSQSLLDLAPPDDNPPLSDLISTYYLCPKQRKDVIMKAVNRTHFQKHASYKDSIFVVKEGL